MVCSQAHSAVKNIYDRLNNVDERIKIGNIDEEETMIPDDLKEHPDFLKNNELLLRDLESCDSTEEISNEAKNSFTYKSSVSDLFKKRHEYICKYYTDNKPNSTMEWIDMMWGFCTHFNECSIKTFTHIKVLMRWIEYDNIIICI